MKGIVLAGGTGSRLWPMTLAVSKQLLPIFNKPMIHYPISTLMLAGIRDILIITTKDDLPLFQKQLGDGSNWGISLDFQIQEKPNGIAEAFIIGENYLKEDSCLLILGDNIFHGSGLGRELQSTLPNTGAQVFTYEVSNPSDYGVINLDPHGKPLSIQEKPTNPQSNLAVTGLYWFDSDAINFAKHLVPSARGELEITSLIEKYLHQGNLRVSHLSRGSVWLDTGNPLAMNDASNYVRVVEERTGLLIGCLEEIAWRNGWLNSDQLRSSIERVSPRYKRYLTQLLVEESKN